MRAKSLQRSLGILLTLMFASVQAFPGMGERVGDSLTAVPTSYGVDVPAWLTNAGAFTTTPQVQ